jgi:hypothetical protein
VEWRRCKKAEVRQMIVSDGHCGSTARRNVTARNNAGTSGTSDNADVNAVERKL